MPATTLLTLPRVLVVDDEPSNLSVFKRAFRGALSVQIATSGNEALGLLRATHVDVLMADYAMPIMDGVELLEAVQISWPSVGRVLITAHDQLDVVRDAAARGLAAEVLAKPWEKSDILRLAVHFQHRNAPHPRD
jgi:CheY-like chemotaxis protein